MLGEGLSYTPETCQPRCPLFAPPAHEQKSLSYSPRSMQRAPAHPWARSARKLGKLAP